MSLLFCASKIERPKGKGSPDSRPVHVRLHLDSVIAAQNQTCEYQTPTPDPRRSGGLLVTLCAVESGRHRSSHEYLHHCLAIHVQSATLTCKMRNAKGFPGSGLVNSHPRRAPTSAVQDCHCLFEACTLSSMILGAMGLGHGHPLH